MQSFRMSFGRTITTAILLCLFSATASAGVFEVDSRSQARLMKLKVQASQFLSRATFGPTIADIDTLAARMNQVGVRRACDEWIEEQFTLPASKHLQRALDMIDGDGLDTLGEPDVWIQRYRYHAWWDIAIRSEDQLRQRVAWALSQIVVTSDDAFGDRNPGNISQLGRWLGPSHYYDMLVDNAFGNYRDVLDGVTYHPIMGEYLSSMKNRKASTDGTRFPDENYAREVMQLFSIGLYELHQDGRLKTTLSGELIPTYDNETIKSFARVFTGLTFKPTNVNNFWWSGNDYLYPMEMYNNEHDMEPKTLLNGQTIDTNDGDGDIQAALDNLFAHNNVGPFISYRLIQRLVKSNPSRAYIRRVARKFDNNGNGVKGDMKAVVKAILLDPEAWRSVQLRTMRGPDRVVVKPRGTEYSRLREPVIRYTSLLRGLEGDSTYANDWMMVIPMDYNWTQEPYRSPSVFSFFLPSYQPPGDLIGFQPSRRIPNGNLVAPEFQMQTAVTSNRLVNRYIWDLSRGGSQQNWSNTNFTSNCDIRFNLDADRALVNEIDLTNNATEAQQRVQASQSDMVTLIDKYDLLFCSGTLPQDYKDQLAYVVLKETDWMVGNTGNDGATPPVLWKDRAGEFRVYTALMCILTSPFAAIEE